MSSARTRLKKLFGFTAPLLYRIRPLYSLYHTAMARRAAVHFGFPGKKLINIGVTGTNGKTTTCNLIHAILTAAGLKAGLISTVNFIVGGKEKMNETKLTSLPPETTQRLLAEMVGKGDRYAVLEVSSIALDQNRFFGVPFTAAVFTNFTHDHLDYHQTMENYLKAKGKLFQNHPRVSVVNLDDLQASFFLNFPAEQKITYGFKTPGAQVAARPLDKERNHFLFTFENRRVEITLKLRGEFNLSNALAAAATAHGLGISLSAIKAGLEKVSFVPGRLEEVKIGQPFRVFVDYAHTPDGFDKSLSALREITSGRLIVVFGATGERDKSKRPKLGEVASRYANLMILTEEDPASEEPLEIIEAIRAGIDDKFRENQNLFILPERREATKKAFSLARPDDTVALLGLGAQTVMVRKEGKIPYHEPTVAKELLQSLGTKRGS